MFYLILNAIVTYFFNQFRFMLKNLGKIYKGF